MIRKSTIDVPDEKAPISRPAKMMRKLTIFDSPLLNQFTPKSSKKDLLSEIEECIKPRALNLGERQNYTDGNPLRSPEKTQ